MKKIITIEMSGRLNFHNSSPLKIIVDTEKTVQGEDGGLLYAISKSQARRIDRHFCGISECICGSGPVVEYNQGQFGISTKF